LIENAAAPKPSPWHFIWLILVLLLTFWLGARSLYAAPLWGDEQNSIRDAFGVWRTEPVRTPLEVWQGVAERNPWNAPGYFIALNLWGRVAGWSEFSLRALSLFCGVLAVAWTYRLGRDLLSPAAGVYAASVVGASALFIHYLYYLRTYALFVLLTPMALWLYFYLIRSRREPGWLVWAGFAATAVGMLYIHYFAALSLAAIGVYHLLFVKKDRRWWKILGLMIVAGLLFLPWGSVMLAGIGRASEDERQLQALSAPQVVEEFIYVFSNGVPLFLGVLTLLALTSRDRRVWRIAFLLLVTLIALLVVNQGVAVILSGRMRYLLGLWPLLALLVGVGMQRLRRWGPPALAVWMCIGLINNSSFDFEKLLNISEYLYKFPWHRVAESFRQVAQPGDALVLSMPDGRGSVGFPNWVVSVFYLQNTPVNATVVESLAPGPSPEQRYQEAISRVERDQPMRVWLGSDVSSEASDLSVLRTALEQQDYVACPVGLTLPAAQFETYSRSPVCCLPGDSTPRIRFGDGIALTDAAPLPHEVSDTLPVLLGWSVAEDIAPYTYSVGLHVDDAEGNLVAQADYGLPEMAFSCQETHIPINDLPPGEYQLYAVVYAWESGQRLEGEVTATGERGERLPVGTFSIRD
jgi:hypothetical protein